MGKGAKQQLGFPVARVVGKGACGASAGQTVIFSRQMNQREIVIDPCRFGASIEGAFEVRKRCFVPLGAVVEQSPV